MVPESPFTVRRGSLRNPELLLRARRADSRHTSSCEPQTGGDEMNPVVERGAGLDVHQATVVSAVRIPEGAGGRKAITETFATTTAGRLTFRAWVHASGASPEALETT